MYKETEYNRKKYLAVHQPVRIELDIEYDVCIDNIKNFGKKRDAIVEAVRPCVQGDLERLRKEVKANIKDWYIL